MQDVNVAKTIDLLIPKGNKTFLYLLKNETRIKYGLRARNTWHSIILRDSNSKQNNILNNVAKTLGNIVWNILSLML